MSLTVSSVLILPGPPEHEEKVWPLITDMPGTDPRSNSEFAAGGAPALLKRRKVRKGTQSCWECKRRKIRCSFAAPTEPVCDGCRSRRVECISQEFHHEAALASRRVDRLSRMESLVEQLVERDMSNTLHRDKSSRDELAELLVRVTTNVLAICSSNEARRMILEVIGVAPIARCPPPIRPQPLTRH